MVCIVTKPERVAVLKVFIERYELKKSLKPIVTMSFELIFRVLDALVQYLLGECLVDFW